MADPTEPATEPERTGQGWRCERLDVVIDVQPGQQVVRVEGEMRLSLLDESSLGPSLAVNPDQPVMWFEALTAPAGAMVELNAPLPDPPDPFGAGIRTAHVRSSRGYRRGDRLELRFVLVSTCESSQFVVRDGFVSASWTQQWLPAPLPGPGAGPGPWMHSAGRTTFRLPRGWRSVSNGALLDRDETGPGAVETWQTDRPVGRSFVAGPHRSTWHTVDGRRVGLHLLSDKPLGVDRQLRMLTSALTAQEVHFGRYPYPTYSVVEIPEHAVSWYASSEQGFIVATSKAFELEHGNLPLWAHEMAHGWWGNLVMADGPGAILCDESLAQYSAVVAIEAIEGPAAVREFLDFSRSGYSRMQCARGYFELASRGEDMPLSAMEGAHSWEHNLSDSKGHWVYHMLRQQIGDDLFFATLRGLLQTFAHRSMRLADVRAAFLAAAPGADLESFFAQWLDRPGAPRFELSWSTTPDGVDLQISQPPPGPPYSLTLEVAVDTPGGRVVHPVAVSDRATRVALAADGEVRGVLLDPDHRVLMWRPEYAAPAPTDRPPSEP